MTPPPLQSAVRILVLAAAYFITGRLGLMFPVFGPHITLTWIPTGIAVAALLRCGFGCWPGVTLGALAVNLATGSTLLTASGIAVGNTAGPLLAAWFLLRVEMHPAFDRRRDFMFLAVGAALGMLASATVGVAMLALAGKLNGGLLPAWLIWWGGDTMGVLTAAPLLLSLSRTEWRTFTSRFSEFFIWLCITGALAYVVFFVPADPVGRMWVPSHVSLPLLAWAAMRFGTIGTSLGIIVLTATAACATAAGHGPFYRMDPIQGVLQLWMFMATCAMLGWLIAALNAGRLNAVVMKETSVDFTNTLIDSMQDGFSLLMRMARN